MTKIPKRWLLITLYIILVYLLGVGIIQWAKRNPIVDEHQQQSSAEQAVPESPEAPPPAP